MSKKSGTTTDAIGIIHRRYFEGKPERLKILRKRRGRTTNVARKIFWSCGPGRASYSESSARQVDWHDRVGDSAASKTTDYRGHSLAMLRRIAAALNQADRDSLHPGPAISVA